MDENMLWAPWRSDFILSEKEKGCVFCNQLNKKDSIKNLILYRGEKVFVVLNKFPYNPGHTMVVPYRHVGLVERLTLQESTEFFGLTQRTVVAMKKALKPNGMNLGMNLGLQAGAGIPRHLHMHIVPRWRGDNNFMPVIGGTPVMSLPLGPIYERLRKELNKG